MKKDPEFKKMMGIRRQNADGFTYVYGTIKDGSTVRPATNTTKRLRRDDKRGTKAKALKRILNESD